MQELVDDGRCRRRSEEQEVEVEGEEVDAVALHTFWTLEQPNLGAPSLAGCSPLSESRLMHGALRDAIKAAPKKRAWTWSR